MSAKADELINCRRNFCCQQLDHRTAMTAMFIILLISIVELIIHFGKNLEKQKKIYTKSYQFKNIQ